MALGEFAVGQLEGEGMSASRSFATPFGESASLRSMGFLYVDETIQQRAGFIIGAMLYSEEDLTPPVFEALKTAGLEPGAGE